MNNAKNDETNGDNTKIEPKKIKVRKLAVRTHIKAAQSKCRYTVSST